MAQIWRGTTPTLTFEYTDEGGTQTIDLSTWTVYLTLTDGFLKYTFTNNRITFNANYSFTITLTEEETLNLHANNLAVQLRAIKDTSVIASEIVYASLEEILDSTKLTPDPDGGDE